VGTEIVDAAYKVHVALGPGLLESVYETCLCFELKERQIAFERQVRLPIRYRGVALQGKLRLDLLVEDSVICEIKAVESIPPVAISQLLTYLKLTDKRLGFLVNFNVPLIKDGIQRVIL
jgi:GxxExxY protein